MIALAKATISLVFRRRHDNSIKFILYKERKPRASLILKRLLERSIRFLFFGLSLWQAFHKLNHYNNIRTSIEKFLKSANMVDLW